jgi:hypothetical protein
MTSNLNVSSYDQALAIIGKYYPLEKIPQQTLAVLEELIPKTRAP